MDLHRPDAFVSLCGAFSATRNQAEEEVQLVPQELERACWSAAVCEVVHPH